MEGWLYRENCAGLVRNLQISTENWGRKKGWISSAGAGRRAGSAANWVAHDGFEPNFRPSQEGWGVCDVGDKGGQKAYCQIGLPPGLPPPLPPCGIRVAAASTSIGHMPWCQTLPCQSWDAARTSHSPNAGFPFMTAPYPYQGNHHASKQEYSTSTGPPPFNRKKGLATRRNNKLHSSNDVQAAQKEMPRSLGQKIHPAVGERTDTATAAAGQGPLVREQQTTVLLRNLPEPYTRDRLYELLNRKGFVGQYNFIYMPMDIQTKYSFGYAFVNFVEHCAAQHCIDYFHGFDVWETDSNKVCDAVWSNKHEGPGSHIGRYQNSPVMHEFVPDEFKPALYAPGTGCRVPFPAPTKRLRALRLRRPKTQT